ncbi:hypothetical protein VNO77_04619 [Canavalia gladiata]|uniref:Uncharacterized protein n=1 Tax=Canavalia gladiata TaxID=3824 RepID=A0AAN9N1Y4_CANGL
MGASQSKQEPQPELHSQSQPQLQQLQPHEPTRKESWLLSPQGNAKASKNSTKAMYNNATPNETQPMTQVKPLKGSLTLPHNYELILKDADSPVDYKGKLLDQLYAGVFLDHKTKKYWVEKKSNSNCNCFLLYARALSITWGEDKRYWKWVQQNEASGTMIEVAELKMVCWLEVHVKFDTKKLSPGIVYQVSFITMLKDKAEPQGWELPINVRLVLPGGKKQQHKENLMEKSRESWIEIPVGEFVPSEKEMGEMEISMYEHDGGMWKEGLVIKGVAIKPKNELIKK